LCISTPQSNLRFASSPAGKPFGIVQAPPKSCPRLRGKCRGASRDKRGTARRCQAVLAFPLSLTSFDSSPAGGGAFWCSINSKPKASLSREVDFAKQKTEGVEKESRFARYRQPLSRLRRQLPGRGAF